MFCYQCQETAKNQGCNIKGVCGKESHTSDLQDMLLYTIKGLSILITHEKGIIRAKVARFVTEALFSTVTNVNFDDETIMDLIKEGLSLKRELITDFDAELPLIARWDSEDDAEIMAKAKEVGVLSTENEDIRSLRELLIYGLKGIAAYYHHANVLGFRDDKIEDFIFKALAVTVDDNCGVDGLIPIVLECGEEGVSTMSLLNKANTSKYGDPEPTEVDIGVNNNPGILISGHDLLDLEELLEQSKDSNIDIYTHGEMLPANSYPFFKKYRHFAGNYGNSWWRQQQDFKSFNGPILMTTNCLVPPEESYKDRVFTTGLVRFKGVKHVDNRKNGSPKDFSPIINMAKNSQPPQEIESGKIMCGFGANSLLSNVDNIINAVTQGLIKRFIVMAGCDGRYKNRNYFTEIAEKLPKDSVILTAGCAKYRYNKLDLGNIGPFPRVIDAGQCNDSYSLALLALKLKETLNLDDINKLPISFDIAWYEQKAVLVLLALLHLGFKNIRLGPTLPAFLSPKVTKVLVEKFNIIPTGDVQEDITAMMAGR